MRGSPAFTLVVAPELLQGRVVVELPLGVVMHVGTPPAGDAPAPASAADENYRLIPFG